MPVSWLSIQMASNGLMDCLSILYASANDILECKVPLALPQAFITLPGHYLTSTDLTKLFNG